MGHVATPGALLQQGRLPAGASSSTAWSSSRFGGEPWSESVDGNENIFGNDLYHCGGMLLGEVGWYDGEVGE